MSCKFSMKTLGGFAISGVCCDCCPERPEIMANATAHYGSAPMEPSFVPVYSFESRRVVSTLGLITHVLRSGGRAKVGPYIIFVITVFVINFIWRPRARHYYPYDAMDEVSLLVYAHRESALNSAADCTSTISAIPLCRPLRAVLPPKYACQGVVRESASQKLCRQVGSRVLVGHSSFPQRGLKHRPPNMLNLFVREDAACASHAGTNHLFAGALSRLYGPICQIIRIVHPDRLGIPNCLTGTGYHFRGLRGINRSSQVSLHRSLWSGAVEREIPPRAPAPTFYEKTA